MDVFSSMISTLLSVFDPANLTFLILGTVVGFVLGIIPGLSGVNGVLIALPFTFSMESGSAMLLIAGMMAAQVIGGSLTAILLRVPGTPMNMATIFDGYPMAKRGEAGRAISIASFASLFAAALSLFLFALLIPVAKQIVLLMGPPELFMLILCGLVAVGYASPGNTMKGLTSIGIGIMISFIGFSAPLGGHRFLFGSKEYFLDGLEILSIMLGLLAISQMIEYVVEKRENVSDSELVNANFKGIFQGLKDIWTYKRTFAHGTIIGFIIGLVPAVGGVLANFLAYTTAMRSSKQPELFGKGTPEGIVASETSNSAKDGGALFPTVAFGIPGSAEMAILLGAFIFHGLQPGPLFIQEHTDIVWILAYGFLFANILAAIISLFLSPLTAIVTRINLGYIIPFIIVSTVIGVYLTRFIIWDVLLLFFFGLFGYLLRRHGFSIISVVMGFVLGPLLEKFYFQSLGSNFGSPSIFFTSPLALCLGLLALFILLWPVISNLRGKKTIKK